MTYRDEQPEKIRRQLRERHILEACCIFLACLLIGICLVYVFDIYRQLWILQIAAILGGVMNLLLAIRSAITRYWFLAIGLFILGIACFGGLGYLTMT